MIHVAPPKLYNLAWLGSTLRNSGAVEAPSKISTGDHKDVRSNPSSTGEPGRRTLVQERLGSVHGPDPLSLATCL